MERPFSGEVSGLGDVDVSGDRQDGRGLAPDTSFSLVKEDSVERAFSGEVSGFGEIDVSAVLEVIVSKFKSR